MLPIATRSTSTATGVASTVASAFLNRAFPGFNLDRSGIAAEGDFDALHAVTDVKSIVESIARCDRQSGGDAACWRRNPGSTGTGNVLNSATSTNNTIVNSIDYRSTGIILRVIPRVSPNGNVRLDVEQEISQATNATASTLTPTVSQRKVKSSVSVANGQTVLLAGLIQEKNELDRGGIPLLDQIPKVGDLFSHQTKTVVRTESLFSSDRRSFAMRSMQASSLRNSVPNYVARLSLHRRQCLEPRRSFGDLRWIVKSACNGIEIC